MVRPTMEHLMDDLAYQIHEFLLEEAIAFMGGHLVFVPITDLVNKFKKNHRTIHRRLMALRDEGLIEPLIKKSYGSLYSINQLNEED